MKKLTLFSLIAVIFTAVFLLNACSTKMPSENDFDLAFFDVITEDGVKVSIPQIFIRFNGKYDDVNFDDFTDMVLTKDGVSVNNKLTYNGIFFQRDTVTDFCLEFENENREPGIYGFTGKYKNVNFEVYSKVIEATPIGNTPANPDDLGSVGYGGKGDENGNFTEVSSIIFNFEGVQQAFFISDLTDLKLTFQNQEIEIEFVDFEKNGRYLETISNNELITSFHVAFREALTKVGTYQLTGNYMNKPFVSTEIIIK